MSLLVKNRLMDLPIRFLIWAGIRFDKTDSTRPMLKLPDERNGILMVFSSYERVSYALILEISDSVRIGDRLINPR